MGRDKDKDSSALQSLMSDEAKQEQALEEQQKASQQEVLKQKLMQLRGIQGDSGFNGIADPSSRDGGLSDTLG